MKRFHKNNVIPKDDIIQKEVDNINITDIDIVQVNQVDNSITKCMLQAKKALKFFTHSPP